MAQKNAEISTTPLPEGFYTASAWFESMVKFYCDERKLLPRDVLAAPLKFLSRDLENIMILEANLPDMAYGFLKQVIDPLFEPQEYRDKVYSSLKENADKTGDQRYIILASSLLNIRCFFERNERFLNENFASQITLVDATDAKEKNNKFGEMMQAITRAHIQQLIDMLLSRR